MSNAKIRYRRRRRAKFQALRCRWKLAEIPGGCIQHQFSDGFILTRFFLTDAKRK